ncbi:MAG: hypothetical protein KBD83_05535 [Gammaproteobacteria bacterium]|nr:hypothetical protein [Gammaproteobacteria bacterium]
MQLRSQDTDFFSDMLTVAFRKGDSARVKSLYYSQPRKLTVDDYWLAIQASCDTDFLGWIIEIILSAEDVTWSQMKVIQILTAEFTKSGEFMASVLQRTGGAASSDTIIAAIEGKNVEVFLAVWAVRRVGRKIQAAAWSKFLNKAILCTDVQVLAQILRDWPQGLAKPEDLSSYRFLVDYPECLQLLLEKQVPFTERSYQHILLYVFSDYIKLKDQLARSTMPIFQGRTIKSDIVQLINKANVIVRILADHDIRPSEANLEYAVQSLPSGISDKMTAICQQQRGAAAPNR